MAKATFVVRHDERSHPPPTQYRPSRLTECVVVVFSVRAYLSRSVRFKVAVG
jgi:hypothetical protein